MQCKYQKLSVQQSYQYSLVYKSDLLLYKYLPPRTVCCFLCSKEHHTIWKKKQTKRKQKQYGELKHLTLIKDSTIKWHLALYFSERIFSFCLWNYYSQNIHPLSTVWQYVQSVLILQVIFDGKQFAGTCVLISLKTFCDFIHKWYHHYVSKLPLIIPQFQMSKENLTESGFEPETSGLTYQHSTNWAIRPHIGGPANC